jgi:hypothetical protein
MFEKKKLFLIVFVIVFSVSSFWANGAVKVKAVDCSSGCDTNGSSECVWDWGLAADNALGDRKTCAVGANYEDVWDLFGGWQTSCTSDGGLKQCDTEKCPSSTVNGAVCTIIEPSGSVFVGCSKNEMNGKWDANEKKCIECSTANKENQIYGSDSAISTLPGDNEFDTACSGTVDVLCDDRIEGFDCDIGKKCLASGQCISPDVLFLTASADPLVIGVSGTSTVTFLVEKGGNPVDVATVENITVTGGFVDLTTCTTDASGECTVTYTAPAIAGMYGVNAEKATKTGETESGPANVVITVSSSAIPPCGPEIGVLCNPVDNASDFYDVVVIAIKYLLSLIALITLLFIVISGIKYLTSFGNEEKMKSAKSGLFSAVSGLVLVLMAYVMLEAIIKILSS